MITVANLPDNSPLKGVMVRTSDGTTGYFGKQCRHHVELWADSRLKGTVKLYPLKPQDDLTSWEVLQCPYYLFVDLAKNPVDCHYYMHKRHKEIMEYSQNKWMVVRDMEEFKDVIELRGLPVLVSFNVDEIAYDAAVWMVGFCQFNRLPLPRYLIHAEGAGSNRVNSYLKTANRFNLH